MSPFHSFTICTRNLLQFHLIWSKLQFLRMFWHFGYPVVCLKGHTSVEYLIKSYLILHTRCYCTKMRWDISMENCSSFAHRSYTNISNRVFRIGVYFILLSKKAKEKKILNKKLSSVIFKILIFGSHLFRKIFKNRQDTKIIFFSLNIH